MNDRFIPKAAVRSNLLPLNPGAAVVTPSYGPDFDRCRLLCETMDEHVSGAAHHYILVEHRDIPLFRQLQGPRRSVVDERELLPAWLRPFNDPLSLFKRRIWLSLKTKPLRGWHVQQLRRIAIAANAVEDMLVYCDSDVVFLKPFALDAFWHDGKARLFRRDSAKVRDGFGHDVWSRNAALALGIDDPDHPEHDYISTLIAWRRDTIKAMCSRIESIHGRNWVEVIASERQFSECMIYGRYVDEVLDSAGHFHGSEELCRVHWFGTTVSDDDFRAFVGDMAPEQVAICMQSFIEMDIGRFRRLIGQSA